MNRRVLVIVAAVVLALLGTFAVYSYGKSADTRAVADTKAATVLVATKRVAAGTSWADAVKAGYLKTEHVPSDTAPSSALTSLKGAAIGNDAVAQSDIAPGQIVVREAFGTKTAQTGVLTIPKGQIAVSVTLPSNANVAGYVGPGSQVVIFATAKLDTKNPNLKLSNGDDLTVTRTLVARVDVLATSEATATQLAGNKNAVDTSSGSSVLLTLALSQRDAERVINQQQIGQLYLGLLSASSKVTNDEGVVNAGAFNPTPIWVK